MDLDFERLFEAGTRRVCVDGRTATMTTIDGDQLTLPSGRLVAYDGPASVVLTTAVDPGTYPVRLAVAERTGHAEDVLVAAARVVVRDHPVNAWRLAQGCGTDFSAYLAGCGVGCFGAAEIFRLLPNDDYLNLVLSTIGVVPADATVEFHDPVVGGTLVTFRAGWGVGSYDTWVGYTDEGEVACFVTDFDVVDLNIGVPLRT